MLFQQVVNLFHNNKKKKVNPTTHSESTTVSSEENHLSCRNSTTSSSIDNPSTDIEEQPKVEFEQSKYLLELDFFHKNEQKENIISFPKFDYLLMKNQPEPTVKQEKSGTLTHLNRKLTKTLRHRMSVYNTNQQKSVKRSTSTPQFI